MSKKCRLSLLRIEKTVQRSGEKNKMYRDSPTRANQPKLLGHPLVYHALPSPWQILSLTVLFDSKHAPGSICRIQSNEELIYRTHSLGTLLSSTSCSSTKGPPLLTDSRGRCMEQGVMSLLH